MPFFSVIFSMLDNISHNKVHQRPNYLQDGQEDRQGRGWLSPRPEGSTGVGTPLLSFTESPEHPRLQARTHASHFQLHVWFSAPSPVYG